MKPCSACTAEPVYEVPQRDGGDGPFIFGVTVAGPHLFWLEQSGGTGAYDGGGTKTSVYRKLLAGGTPERLRDLAGGFTRLVVNGDYLWLASNTRTTGILRLDKTCTVSQCIEVSVAGDFRINSMVPHKTGVAAAADGALVVVADSSATKVGVDAVTLARFGDSLVYANDAVNTTMVSVLEPVATAPLSTAWATGGFKPFGASLLASDCSKNIWAFQAFKGHLDGSPEVAHYALTRTSVGIATPASTAVTPPAYALVSDDTHAYAGFPDTGGILRWDGLSSSTVKPVAPGKSAWSLAMTDDYVYFDDHGADRGKQSLGIYRLKKSR